jgi:hypothetical protein
MKGGWEWVGWLLVVAGWWYVNRTNNQRETRKEARSAVDAAKKDVQAIAKLAVAYFTDANSVASDEIKNSLELLEVELERLEGYASSQVMNRMSDFHEACTGADFESANRQVHGLRSEVVQGILYRRNRLIAEIERHYLSTYVTRASRL